MSLIRIRRERRDGGGKVRPPRPPSLWKLAAGLALVLILIWYLSKLG